MTGFRRISVIVPKWTDVRVWVALYFIACVSWALTFDGYSRSVAQLSLSLGTAVALDTLLHKARHGHWVFPMSGALPAIGPFLIVDSSKDWAYALMAFVAIGSKHFIRWNDRHVFNPVNFTVLLVSLGLPELAAPNASRWGGDHYWTLIILTIGFFIAWKAERWLVSVSYFFTFLLGCLARSAASGLPYQLFAGVTLGPIFQLLCFQMITDPRTSPGNRRAQLAYGALIGALDSFFRFQQLRLSLLSAVFTATIAYAVYERLTGEAKRLKPWKERTLHYELKV